MVIKLPRFPIASPSKIYPNWDVWFENKPSGNLATAADDFFQFLMR
jgi:hypothetical protein